MTTSIKLPTAARVVLAEAIEGVQKELEELRADVRDGEEIDGIEMPARIGEVMARAAHRLRLAAHQAQQAATASSVAAAGGSSATA